MGALLMVDMAHRGPGGGGHAPQPHPLRGCGHHHHPQNPARARGSMILCKKKFARAIDKAIFPGIQGGPLMHIIAAKAVCFKEAMGLPSKPYQGADHQERQGPGKSLPEAGRAHGCPAERTTTCCCLIFKHGHHRPRTKPCWGTPTSPSTRTWCPRTAASPTRPAGCASAPPPSPPRGMKEEDMDLIAHLIARIIKEKGSRRQESGRGDQADQGPSPVLIFFITAGGISFEIPGLFLMLYLLSLAFSSYSAVLLESHLNILSASS